MTVRKVEASLDAAGTRIELVEFNWTEDWTSQRQNPVHTLSKLIAPTRLVEHLRMGNCDMVRGNALAFIPAEVPVGMRAARGIAKFGICQFSSARYDEVTGCGREWDTDDLQLCADIRNPLLDRVIGRLVQEAISPGLASEILVDSLSVVAMVELARYLEGARQRRARYRGGLAPWQMSRVADYVENRTDAPVLVAELAELCGISDGHLARAFKQSTGQTLHAYVEEVRLRRAKTLLMSSDIPLAEIAAKLGFANASGFTIAFRRAAGEPPSAYRRRATRH